jgi:transketolase
MTLRHVPLAELERIRSLDADPVARAQAFADACRINVLYMVQRAGSGHLGTSFSSIDIVSWLHLEVLDEGDRYFSSKGHDAPALYAVLAGTGRIDFELIHELRRLGGLPGHPDVLATPQVTTNTGSLGMGISKAKGFVHADRLAGRGGRVFVLTGDGELQEGQFWESLQGAANRGLAEITVIVDHNKIQSDTWVEDVSALGALEDKLRVFGWHVQPCDGNDIGALRDALATDGGGRPRVIVADTLKGAGVSFMEPRELPRGDEGLYAFHSGAPSPEDYERALDELEDRLAARMQALGADAVVLADGDPPGPGASAGEGSAAPPQRLIAAYADALVRVGERDERVVALDADLVLDCGLIPFRERFPERFFECGIAEQDMVSTAGAMALAGLVPVVHSFACFLSTRPNEQIYNNASEGTKVVYVGSLAGLVPGGPGHSHQSVRDISALGGMPGMALIEPLSEHEACLALDWAVDQAPGSAYIRLVSVPWPLPFDPPRAEALAPGRGDVVREGDDALLVAAGPVMASQVWLAADALEAEGVSAAVLALPWLRGADGEWLSELAGERPVVCVDNHYVAGGQGEAVLAALNAAGHRGPVELIGVDRLPECGSNDEVLRAHELDGGSIARRVKTGVLARA